jgi:hypothetical protein
MIDKRPAAGRILIARLTGTARRLAGWLAGLAAEDEAPRWPRSASSRWGVADLLAEVAGIEEGASEGELREPRGREAARLCRLAGADPEAIGGWAEEGRRRMTEARRPPLSGGLR